MLAQPSGTVTFLFTDIEGSTRLWERYPDTMREALRWHDVLLRDAIQARRGVVFKTMGDACCAAFAAATDAFAAALAAQRALLAREWDGVGPLRVRMALHTGVAEERDDDYFGPPLNRVARLLSLGHGGQVLLSAATQELARDALPPDISLRDLGEQRLKGLARPERVFQIVAPDLPADFPPLAAPDARPHNLPVSLTPFIGREHDLWTVRKRLLEPQTRLLTLTGPGGAGKTRLALQVASEVAGNFPDGVFFVSLAPLTDPALVLPTIAAALGVVETAGEPLVATLTRRLGETRTLPVLDNFEHVAAAAGAVGEMLAACPRVTALVTSRSVLHVRGERSIALAPMAVPDIRRLSRWGPAALGAYDAVRLFVARAEDARAGFELTDENAPVVAEICARLDGLPLAIELAAARTRILSPQAILARLGSRLTLLTGGDRDAPDRQRTLRGAIEWSYDLLDADERRLFARLAVFAGGATPEAVEAVCAGDDDTGPGPEPDALDGLTSLTDNSLLRQDEQPDGEPRFNLLETIREYAAERLAGTGEGEALRRRHAAYYLALAERAAARLTGAEQEMWLAVLEREHDNIRGVLQWARRDDEGVGFAAERRDVGLRLAGALWPFWNVRGYLTEGRGWLDGLLADVDAAAAAGRGAPLSPIIRARALNAAGILADRQGDYARATACYEEGAALYRGLGDKDGLARTLNNLGIVAHYQGDYAGATALYEEALALRREVGDRWAIAASLSNMGLMARDQGDLGRAAALCDESVAIRRALGDRRGIALALQNLGLVAVDGGDYTRAVALFEESLAHYRALDDGWGIASQLNNLALVARGRGEFERAARLYKESLTLLRDVGAKIDVAESLEGLAMVSSAQGGYERAARLYGAAARLRAIMGAPLQPSDRAAHNRTVETVRAALGDRYAAARVVGEEMTLDRAIAYAMAESMM